MSGTASVADVAEAGLVPPGEAVRRLVRDRALLEAAVTTTGIASLEQPYTLDSGPLGDFCQTLHDLLAHILMWDEINLAVLTDARRGRTHWSLDARWEIPAAGRALNRAGVAAGQRIDAEPLLHRFASARAALVDEVTRLGAEQWATPVELVHPAATSIGALAQHLMTVPGHPAYWHAAIHLGHLPAPTARGRQDEGA